MDFFLLRFNGRSMRWYARIGRQVMECVPLKSTAGDGLRDRDEELFRLFYFVLVAHFSPFLSVSRKKSIAKNGKTKYTFDGKKLTLSEMLSVVKRFDGYESIGGLFRQANVETIELTVKERILLIIKKILTEYAENMDLGIDFFLEHIFAENEQFKNIINVENPARAG